MRKLRIIMAYSALETVPREIASHPQIRAYAERRRKPPTKVILDKSYHFHAMKSLKDKEMRGRPDMVFAFLLAALASPLNQRGLLEVYVHTRDDYVIFVNPKMKPIRSYERFLGIMEKLFEEGRVPEEGEPLMEIRNMGLEYLVKKVIGTEGIVLLEHGGRLVPPKRIAEMGREYPIVVQGFPRGDFGLEAYKIAKEKAYIFPTILDSWLVADRIIAAYEEISGVYG
ncbi:16S rRNA methyltransferase [Ignicoccus pacificus DSM 13166]|uniref:Ribosomal RNA small subunit methyltransferase Nep1 n=1 Tax=Ignicoccus pacificus DSM 13166 TaxID=940294 RepID=A0A977K984_9CREN|nr:16S rRNA methyltransferase [Ignicoccus pacificus DSM 13166]